MSIWVSSIRSPWWSLLHHEIELYPRLIDDIIVSPKWEHFNDSTKGNNNMGYQISLWPSWCWIKGGGYMNSKIRWCMDLNWQVKLLTIELSLHNLHWRKTRNESSIRKGNQIKASWTLVKEKKNQNNTFLITIENAHVVTWVSTTVHHF